MTDKEVLSSAWVTLWDVAARVARASTVAHPESWDKPDANNGLRRAIGAAVMMHGSGSDAWPVPPMLGLFLRLWREGVITPRHPDTYLEPPRDADVDFKWVITAAEAKEALGRLTPPKKANPVHRWKAPDQLEELRAYRERHGTKKAAEHFGISMARVRQLLPGPKPAPTGYSAFNQAKRER